MNDVKVHIIKEPDRANFSMRYTDPVTGKFVKKTAGTSNRKDALKAAAKWEAELQAGRYVQPNKITWQEFRERFEQERLGDPSKSTKTRKAYFAAFNHFERVIGADRLCKVTTETISRFVRELRKARTEIRNGKKTLLPPMRESSIACHLRHLKAACNWAVKMGLMNKAPHFDMPNAGEAKGRAISGEELERMLAVIPTVRPHDPGIWTRFVYGVWLSGLRLQEALALSWDEDAGFAIDLTGEYPAFRIKAKSQKGRRSETVPMTPDFATWVLQTPEEDRAGAVFQMPGLLDNAPLTPVRVSRIVAKFGEKAGIVVGRERRLVNERIRDPKTGKPTDERKLVEREVIKYATLHDLRRAFCSRWARQVTTAVLQKLARHRSITTTMRYYVNLEADDIAAGLWRGAEAASGAGLGTVSGTIGQRRPQNTVRGSGDEMPETPCAETTYGSGGQGSRTPNRLPGA